jgi:acetyl esterase/lipase
MSSDGVGAAPRITPGDGTTIVRDIALSRPAGRPLRLDIYRPSASGRYPIVIQIYGGAWQRGAPTLEVRR